MALGYWSISIDNIPPYVFASLTDFQITKANIKTEESFIKFNIHNFLSGYNNYYYMHYGQTTRRVQLVHIYNHNILKQ